MNNSFTYSSKSCVFRKSYGGDIHITVALELPQGNLRKDKRNKAIRVFKDEIFNLLNDKEMENLLRPQRNQGRDEACI